MPESAAVTLILVSVVAGSTIPVLLRWVTTKLRDDHDAHATQLFDDRFTSPDVLDELRAIIREEVDQAVRGAIGGAKVASRADLETLTADVEHLRALVGRHELRLERHARQVAESQRLMAEALRAMRAVSNRHPDTRTRHDDPEHRVVDCDE